MAGALKILKTAQFSPQSITFTELERLVVAAEFKYQRSNGDHAICTRADISKIVNLQPRKGDKRMAKTYQVEQVVGLIARHKIEVR